MFSEYKIKIRLYGDYNNFTKFIKDIEKVPFIKVRSLFIKRDESNNLAIEIEFLGEVKS